MMNHVESFDLSDDDEELYYMVGAEYGQNHVTYNHVHTQQQKERLQKQQQKLQQLLWVSVWNGLYFVWLKGTHL